MVTPAANHNQSYAIFEEIMFKVKRFKWPAIMMDIVTFYMD